MLMVEFVKITSVPVVGTPFAVKLALNQMKLPLLIGVPLKFDPFDVFALHLGGGGGVGQVMLLGEKLIDIVLSPTNVAVPEKVRVPVAAGLTVSDIVSLKVPELGALKLTEPVWAVG